jgi:ABC-type amino acid transport substrate-binding protein
VTTTLSLVVNGAKRPAIRGLADMKGGLVGVQAATTDYDAALATQKRGQIGGIKVYSFDRIEEAMTDLAAGRITAVMKVAPVAHDHPPAWRSEVFALGMPLVRTPGHEPKFKVAQANASS